MTLNVTSSVTVSATALTLMLMAGGVAAQPFAGVVETELRPPHHDRAMKTAIWYPATQDGTAEVFAENPVFYGTDVLRDAAPAPGAYPVVLLSHGMGGNYMAMQWLAAGIAARGAVVVSVNHPNSSTWDFDMAKGAHHGSRPMDLSYALDWLQESDYAPLITDQVMAAGFSFGGWTSLSLGGAVAHLDGYIAACDAAHGQSSHCNDLERMGVDLGALDADLWNASYRDARVDHVFAIDPGLHWGVRAQDMDGFAASLTLIGLGEGTDRLYATDFEASGFGALVPDADVAWLAPAAHFSMLPLCKPAGAAILAEERDDPVCTDPQGTDRGALHDLVVDKVAAALGL